MKGMKNMNNQDSPTPSTASSESTPQPTPVPYVAVSHAQRLRRFVIVCVVILLCAGAGYAGYVLSVRSQGGDITTRQSVKDDGNRVITQEEEAIANVVTKVSPSVVSIVTQTVTASPYGMSRAAEGAGTGVIIGADGYILTNKHVIDDAQKVQVVLSDGTTYSDVKVLGADPLNDIAFLKINDASNLPVADLGDSTSVRVGQRVVAIGNSLGQYQNTVTSGIISGKGRPIAASSGESVESLTDLLQTDAAINPGNSGGPLLNLQGQVIGINTAIIEDAQGIGFSIPIGATKGLIKGVLRGDGVKRAYLGVNYIAVTADVAAEYKLPVKQGAYVYSGSRTSPVVSGSPADKAGIKAGDIITKVGDISVGDQGGVASLVAEYMPGDTITLTILRDGKTTTRSVTLGSYNES